MSGYTMGEIGVLVEGLQSRQASINETYGALQTALEQLSSDLEPMIGSWTGSAQQAYLVQKKSWNEGAEALAQVLHSIARSLGDAHDSYQAAHEATKPIWS